MLRAIVVAVFRHRRLWILVVLTVSAATALYIAMVPRRYISEMDILVQNKRGDEQISPNRINGEITINGVTEEQINSEIQLLTSSGLASQVITPGWSQSQEESMSRAQVQAHDKALQSFEHHLSVNMVRKSNVIHVAYLASDPQTATSTLERLLAAFLKKQQDIAQPPGTSRFFAEKAASYKQQLDQAQDQLATYQQQNKIVSVPDSEQELDHEIDEAQSDLRATDAQIGELTQQIGSETAHLHAIPPRHTTQVRTIPNDYSIERLNTMLAELENKRVSLLTKFRPDDRLVQEVDRQIADTKTALAHAEHMTSQENDTDINPVWQSLTGSIIQNETQREALKAKHAALSAQVTSIQRHLSGVEGATVTFNSLRQRVEDLKNNYELYAQKRDEAQIADEMNASRLLNVAVAQSPTFGAIPYRPKPLMDSALGAFSAVFFAAFLVFLAEIGRDTFASDVEVEGALKLPVFAVIPLVHVNRRQRNATEFQPVFIGMNAAPDSAGDRPVSSPTLVRYQREKQSQ